MQHWWQIATRNWRTRLGRTALTVVSIALGVGVVVWVTCCYESVRRGVTEVVLQWIGRSHVVVESSAGVWAVFDADVEDLVKTVPGISHVTTHTQEYVMAAAAASPADEGPNGHAPASQPSDADYLRIEVVGVIPDRERLFRTYKLAEGRFLDPSDAGAVVVESQIARLFDVGLGETIFLRHLEEPNPPRAFTIVGIVDRRRASANQAMMAWARLGDVQTLCKLPNQIKAIDVIVADPTVENIRRIADRISILLEQRETELESSWTKPRLKVQTTEAQHKKLGAAQSLLQFIMMLLSCVVLLTAFFIMAATMSMGVTERITELGILRCIGMTRWQLSGLVLLQTLPLGLVGTILGLPLGLALQWLTFQAVPDYLGQFVYAPWGMALAAVGGIATTLFGAAVPAVRALRISPVEATRTAGDPRLIRWVWGFAALGLVLIAAHVIIGRMMVSEASMLLDIQAIAGIALLYIGCALIVPAVVLVLGRAVVAVAARVLGLRPQLLGDEIARSPFRSAAICCGLMVGLSLIVGLVVWGESVKRGWQFPKEFPDALLYSYSPLPLDKVRALRDSEGIAEFTVTDDFPFSLKPPTRNPLLQTFSVMERFSRFLAIDPDTGLAIVRLSFLEGDEHTARADLERGGHVLITREFSQAQKKGVGDKVTIWVGSKKATFTISGVVASPGLDIAISFFNAGTYFQTYSVGAMIGTLADAERLFNRKHGKLILFNFDLPPGDGASKYYEDAPTFGGQTEMGAQGLPTFALGPGKVVGDGPEEQVVNRMLERLDFPPKAFVTARELKQQIDRNISRVTLLLSVIPVVALLIAAFGLGNLMAANVASRYRELAILRAIGVTKNQMSRMVLGEALVLAIFGSALGLGLGLLLGRTSNAITELIWGFRPDFSVPWQLAGAGAALATLLCMLAAVLPARYAGRSNIVAALSEA
jgi:putative ABC transport system permease protein